MRVQGRQREYSMHFNEHQHPFSPERPVNRRRSSLLSPFRHSHWDCRHRSALSESTFLRSLRSISVTRLHRYYGRSDSCCPALRDLVHELRLFPQQVSLIHASDLPDHSVSKHLMPRRCRFITLPLSATAFPCGSRLRHFLAGSSIAPGRIEFVILRTGRSPPAALHHTSLCRSCIRLQAGERLPGEDFHLSDHLRFQAH
jgi:hypothetical protein